LAGVSLPPAVTNDSRASAASSTASGALAEVTMVVTRRVRQGMERQFLQCVDRLSEVRLQKYRVGFPTVVVPPKPTDPFNEYTVRPCTAVCVDACWCRVCTVHVRRCVSLRHQVVIKFENYKNLMTWQTSPDRHRLIEELNECVRGPGRMQHRQL
jgi:hypothetical protein